MKNSLLLTTIIALLFSYSPFSVLDKEKPYRGIEKIISEDAMSEKLLRHVVLFKFKDNTSSEEIAEVEEAFSALPDKISEIKEYEWGINNSPEGLDKGFTHCFLVTFESEEDRATYLPHPDHQAFVEILEPHLEDVLVIDYWAGDE
ncbi:Dabb family protein, partial [Fodinibius sp.]|uniref:Dabb family protein n=1 Tax=Fodinibius sp. TaxID=1872440 RepID=UPI0035630C58